MDQFERFKYDMNKMHAVFASSMEQNPVNETKGNLPAYNSFVEEAGPMNENVGEVAVGYANTPQKDEVTGLLTKAGARPVMSLALREAKLEEKCTAFLIFTLQKIKKINDTMGFEAGDSAIRVFTSRLQKKLGNRCTIARLEGVKFIVITTSFSKQEVPVWCASKIIEAAKEPFVLRDRIITLDVSVGSSTYPVDGEDLMTIYRNAEAAMVQCEKSAAEFILYSNDLRKQLMKKKNMEERLKNAIDEGCREFKLYFLPKVEMRTGRVTGCEALMRWFTNGGSVPPSEFIPIAEESGLIVPLSWWLIQECCRHSRVFEENGISCTISLNIPAQVLLHKDFLTILQKAMRNSNAKLDVEIVEAALLEDFSRVETVIDALHKMGIQVSVDDFGTGLSSMTNLYKLAIDRIKIDRSFINQLKCGEKDSNLIKTIVSMAKNLEMVVTAEGVEDEDQYDFLKNIGCDEIQGYFITPALPGGEFLEFIN